MLSWSAGATGRVWDPRAITDPGVDPLLPGGSELIELVDAVHSGDAGRTAAAREALRAVLGGAALVDAAGVIGNFNQMNRLADATGIPVGPGMLRRTADLRTQAGIVEFH